MAGSVGRGVSIGAGLAVLGEHWFGGAPWNTTLPLRPRMAGLWLPANPTHSSLSVSPSGINRFEVRVSCRNAGGQPGLVLAAGDRLFTMVSQDDGRVFFLVENIDQEQTKLRLINRSKQTILVSEIRLQNYVGINSPPPSPGDPFAETTWRFARVDMVVGNFRHSLPGFGHKSGAEAA